MLTGVFEAASQVPLLTTIRQLDFLNLDHGPWVAGGAVRRLLMGDTEAGDIDVFLPTHFARLDHPVRQILNPDPPPYPAKPVNGDALIVHLRQHPAFVAQLSGSFNPRIRLASSPHAVQIIVSGSYASLTELFSSFDFTVCKAATDGWRWIADERCLPDLASRSLVVNPTLPGGKLPMLSRLMKYAALGFTPRAETLRTTFGMDDDRWTSRVSYAGFIHDPIAES